MVVRICAVFSFFLLISFRFETPKTPFFIVQKTENPLVQPFDTTRNLTTIAFGSCNKLDKQASLFGEIAENKPDLFLWLGDIIYADTRDMKRLENMYKALKTIPDYKKLMSTSMVAGVYDDHDFGENDAFSSFPFKKESRDKLYDFLEISKTSYLRKREGAYQSYVFGKEKQKVRVILIDTRYFRDSLISDETHQKRYVANTTGTMLGAAQWAWLEKELAKKDVGLTILGSSIQVVADDHGHEKWGNFPNERKKLLQMIGKTKPKNLLILSGDRHMAEISKCSIPGLPYALYDLTSSGLTHTRTMNNEENRFRSGNHYYVARNFGLLKIDWTTPEKPTVTCQMRGEDNALLGEEKIVF
jgi:alkaline phosphatase D